MSDKHNTGTWNTRLSRRSFVSGIGAAAAVGAAGLPAELRAQELPRLDESDPTARALNYAHDATTVDAAKRFEGRFCNNCVLYQGAADDDWAACSIFPGKLVAGKGWCSAWAPKPGQ